MTVAELDFRNPVGLESFDCFGKDCIIERNTNEGSGANINTKDVQSFYTKKTVRSNCKVQGRDQGESDKEISVFAVGELSPKPWNPCSELKLPCSLTNYKHEVRKCKEFLDMSPRDRWEKLKKGRMCFSCLKPKTIFKGRKCNHVSSGPEVWK